MPHQRENTRTVAADQKVRTTCLSHCQQEVVCGIRRAIDGRQALDYQRELPKIIDEAPNMGRHQACSECWSPNNVRQFDQLLGGRNQIELPQPPGRQQFRRLAVWVKQAAQQDIGIEDDAHRASEGTFEAFCPDFGQGLLDFRFEHITGHIAVVIMGGCEIQLHQPPTDRLGDEAGQVTLLRTMRSQMRSQGDIRLAGNRDGPFDGIKAGFAH